MFSRSQLIELKSTLLTEGVRVAIPRNQDRFFYSIVTSGIDLVILGNIYVNSPINLASKVILRGFGWDSYIEYKGYRVPVTVLNPYQALWHPLLDGSSERVGDYIFAAADRINIWAIENCSLAVYQKPCIFCDVAFDNERYRINPTHKIRRAIDQFLKAHGSDINHCQVSGGTPMKDDWRHYIDVCLVALEFGLPVSVMTSITTPQWVFEELREIGVSELAINIEIANDKVRKELCPGKSPRNTWSRLQSLADSWPEGSIRSTLIVGLESVTDTIAGVKRFLECGVLPVLSPFRPAPGTPMFAHKAVKSDFLKEVLYQSEQLAKDSSLVIGPTCEACQHNVLALPVNIRGGRGQHAHHAVDDSQTRLVGGAIA